MNSESLPYLYGMDADVAIVGAGPAGSSAALSLKDSGLRVCLIDKATFPRDKVCGDAIPGLAIKTLRRIDSRLADQFAQLPHHLQTRKTRFVWQHRHDIELQWVLPAYTCAREAFDAALLNLTYQHTDTTVWQGTSLQAVTHVSNGLLLNTSRGPITARMVIGCDGSRSVVARSLRSPHIDPLHYGAAVRQYVEGVDGLAEDRTEIFGQKAFLPGYFWVFPLPNGRANVGFGMRSDEIRRRRINLRHTLSAFINGSPELQDRFSHARPLNAVQGFGLPFGSQRVPISGERILLAGDAASLIDPLSGDGIGYAMLSGYLAAQQVIQCFSEGQFDARATHAYSDALWQQIGPELQQRAQWQRYITQYPWLGTLGMSALQIPALKRHLNRLV